MTSIDERIKAMANMHANEYAMIPARYMQDLARKVIGSDGHLVDDGSCASVIVDGQSIGSVDVKSRLHRLLCKAIAANAEGSPLN